MSTVTGYTAEMTDTLLEGKLDVDALVAGTNITLTPDVPTVGKLTIASSGGDGASFEQAKIQSTSGTVKMSSGEGNSEYADTRWGTPSYIVGGTGAPSWITTGTTGAGTAHEIYLEEGWYECVGLYVLTWSVETDAPGGLGPYMGGGYDPAHQDYSAFPIMKLGSTKWGISQYVNFGKFFFHTGDEIHPEIRPIDAWATGNSDGVSDKVLYTFTKLS